MWLEDMEDMIRKKTLEPRRSLKTQASPATTLLLDKDNSESWNTEKSTGMKPGCKGHGFPICLEEEAKMEAV